MSTKLTLRPPLPFSNTEDKDEIKTYFTDEGFTVSAISSASSGNDICVELVETLDQSQKDTLQTQIETDIKYVVFE